MSNESKESVHWGQATLTSRLIYRPKDGQVGQTKTGSRRWPRVRPQQRRCRSRSHTAVLRSERWIRMPSACALRLAG